MTGLLEPGVLLEAAELALDHAPLPADQVLAGTPTTGEAVLYQVNGAEIGVWEMTPGSATDVEANEFFVVIAGRATLQIDGAGPVELTPGAAMHLTEGMRTIWTVHETLRKVYMA